MDKISDNIKELAFSSIKWSTLTETAIRLIPPLVTIILARILVPADFGLVSIATIIISFSQMFLDFGLGKTLIQRETNLDESANIVFWTNILFGILIYGILFVISPYIADFFGNTQVTNVLRVLCFQIVLMSFITVHLALLKREFKFRKLFFIRFLPSILPGLISIPLAFCGWGVWALVFGSLAGTFIQVILCLKISHWRPKPRFDYGIAKEIYSFSIWVLLEMFLGWLIIWGDSIILGHFLGIKELGIYSLGISMITLVFGLVFNPIIPIAYSSFARLQSHLEELDRSFINSITLMATISLPIGFFLLIEGNPISNVFFGQKWQGLGIVLSIIGLTYSLSYLVSLNTEMYRAFGRPDANVKLLFANVIYYIPTYLIAAPMGLLIFCLARFGVAAISLLLHFYVANKLLKVPFLYIKCVKSPLIASILMAITILLITNFMYPFNGFGGFIKLIIVLIIGLILYIVFITIIDRDLFNNFLNLTKKVLNI